VPVRSKEPPPELIMNAWRKTEEADEYSEMDSAGYIGMLLQCLDVLREHAVDRGGVMRITASRAPVSAVVALDQGDFFGFLPRDSEEYVIFPRAATASAAEKYVLFFNKLFNVPAGWVPRGGQRIRVISPARIPKRVFDVFLEQGLRSVEKVDTFDVKKGNWCSHETSDRVRDSACQRLLHRLSGRAAA